MAQPSGARNFFGRVVDRILPGSQYDSSTGQYSNVGAGLAGLGARLAATAFAGPAVGALVGKGAGYLIDRNGNRVGPVQQEGVTPYASVDPGIGNSPVSMPSVNYSQGVQTPGNQWSGYLQSPGSINNLGNQSFNLGRTNWGGPLSQWGKAVADQNPGSNLNFGNQSPGAVAAGGSSEGGGMSSGRMSSGGMPGIIGGRFAGSNAVQYLQNQIRRSQ